MTAQEIQNMDPGNLSLNSWLQEIATQLARINERDALKNDILPPNLKSESARQEFKSANINFESLGQAPSEANRITRYCRCYGPDNRCDYPSHTECVHQHSDNLCLLPLHRCSVVIEEV